MVVGLGQELQEPGEFREGIHLHHQNNVVIMWATTKPYILNPVYIIIPDFEETHLKQRQEDLATPTPFNLSSGTPMSSNSRSVVDCVVWD